jgi:hypothetical protein
MLAFAGENKFLLMTEMYALVNEECIAEGTLLYRAEIYILVRKL